jgi:hypothetical protein
VFAFTLRAGNVIETHEHAGEFKESVSTERNTVRDFET